MNDKQGKRTKDESREIINKKRMLEKKNDWENKDIYGEKENRIKK
jgi:hypothetical protein